jgi:bidirectional [NiFe] hydrogenase diaphorase subunit
MSTTQQLTHQPPAGVPSGSHQPPDKIAIKIDGAYIEATSGQTILEAARANGKYIPTLCYLEGLSAVGACRLCIVEVSGVGRLLPACTTPVEDGMSVTTNSEKLTRYRRMAIEFLFSERNHYCAVCVSSGHCELQSMAQRLGVTSVEFPYSYPLLPVDMSHERFVLDHNRCILCTRCVRVCDEVEGAHVFDVISRGIRSMISCDLNRPWGQARNCTSCGKCVQVCPTGALAEKGWAVEEMTKRADNITWLALRRGDNQ